MTAHSAPAEEVRNAASRTPLSSPFILLPCAGAGRASFPQCSPPALSPAPTRLPELAASYPETWKLNKTPPNLRKRQNTDYLSCTGAANIGDAGSKAAPRKDEDVVPEAAVRPSQENTDFHTGRGGAGNEHIAKKTDKADQPRQSLADKLKSKIVSVFKK
jgi:hypothetical protein